MKRELSDRILEGLHEESLIGNIQSGNSYEADVGVDVFPVKGKELVRIKRGGVVIVDRLGNGECFFSYAGKKYYYPMQEFRENFRLRR